MVFKRFNDISMNICIKKTQNCDSCLCENYLKKLQIVILSKYVCKANER